ncbi:TauD/TfdA family dioxygenase [Plantactinospora sp. KLBMP9567]|uniref:TauD/TfdA family dioxygenase n=1 Tax=Plantactinospora sp. KLBMP9567 TaxID=3085900 RepID=UPI0029813D32|nr:TauD/TfdA family dioxygenase [Plantactinospora sp. KLBMP9567]MDW5328861.1 TauD/TfdA family dioxygenase [Plantactinospora sp. KLBMP9567]
MTTLPTAAGHVVSLRPAESAPMWRAGDEVLRATDLVRSDPDEMMAAATAVAAAIPSALVRAVHAYRSRAEHGDVLLVRGVLPETNFGTNPSASAAPLAGHAVQRAALQLLGITMLLGEPFNFRTLYEGKLVQHVVPAPNMEFTQTSESSSGMLDWHVEDGFSPDRCDYFGLLCLRGAEAAVTRYAAARDVVLDDRTRRILSEPRFEMAPDSAHVLDDGSPCRTPVLFGAPHAPEICYDDHYLTALDGEGKEALRELRTQLDAVHHGHVLRPGDLLVIDNRRVVHSRTPFAARHDGTDRWLLRTMVCASLPRFRAHGRRII